MVDVLFSAYAANEQTNATGDGTVVTVAYNTEIYDLNNNYNNATFTFTAPNTGLYLLIASVFTSQNGGAHTTCELTFVTSNRTYRKKGRPIGFASSNNDFTYANQVIADFDAGDTAIVRYMTSGSTKTVDITASSAADQRTYFTVKREG
jgi:hypothetical protein